MTFLANPAVTAAIESEAEGGAPRRKGRVLRK